MTESKSKEEIKIKAKQVTDNLVSFMKELGTEANKQIKELEYDIDYYKSKIIELEKENAELKERNLSAQDAVTMQMYTNKANKEIADKQLTKAKELIENIIRVTWGEGWNYSLDWKVKAERFLNSEA